ncbi:MAG: sensor domain-containing diguanylate cyclase [Gammaproteobacteria bacterium]|nr:sensor domain-containing diguanylate cyclase [Gammaproteobacteria bacterium]
MNQPTGTNPDLSTERTWQAAVLDSRDYLVMALDPHGVIRSISAGGLLQLGYKLEELRGKIAPAILFEPREITRRARRLSEELGENIEPGFKVFVFRAQQGIPDEQEWNCVRRDGSHFPVRMSLHPQRDAGGEVSGFIAMARNVSDLIRARKDLSDRETQLKVAHARLAATTVTDELTGMKNRRAFNEHLEREFQRGLRHHSMLSLIFANIDDIKGYNAEYGHHAGDELIKMVSEQILKDTRSTDYVARFAGDEFAFVLPQTDREGAMIKADRLRESIESSEWPLRPVTVSVGVATMTEESPVVQDLTNSRTLISRARDALFEAKRTGANRTTHFREITKDGADKDGQAEQA